MTLRSVSIDQWRIRLTTSSNRHFMTRFDECRSRRRSWMGNFTAMIRVSSLRQQVNSRRDHLLRRAHCRAWNQTNQLVQALACAEMPVLIINSKLYGHFKQIRVGPRDMSHAWQSCHRRLIHYLSLCTMENVPNNGLALRISIATTISCWFIEY